MGISCSSRRSVNLGVTDDRSYPHNDDLNDDYETTLRKIIIILGEIVNPDPFKIYNVGKVLSQWTSQQKLGFVQSGGFKLLLDRTNAYVNNYGALTPVISRKNENLVDDGVGFGTGSTSSQWNIKKVQECRRKEEMITEAAIHTISAYVFKLNVTYNNPNLSVFLALTGGSDHLNHDIGSMLESYGNIQNLLTNESILDISEHLQLYASICKMMCSFCLYKITINIMVRPRGSADAKCLYEYFEFFYSTISSYVSQSAISSFFDEGFSHFADEVEELLSFAQECLRYFTHEIPQKSQLNSLYPLTAVPQQSCSSSIDPNVPVYDREMYYANALRPVQFDSATIISPKGRMGLFMFEKDAAGFQPFSLANRLGRISKEIATMRKSMPLNCSSSIFVRIDEMRADIMKALITGPEGTPYQNGCFVFDIFFPKDYPNNPPKVALVTTGGNTVRFNPNLYNDGKVCLSILNTWEGRPEERWNSTSSLLQVLVSIQALIFVQDPYFNEPGFEKVKNSTQTQDESMDYNHRIRHANLKFAVLEQLKHPEPVFREVILRHMALKKEEILRQMLQWIREVNQFRDNIQSRSNTVHDLSLVVSGMENTQSECQNLLHKLYAQENYEN